MLELTLRLLLVHILHDVFLGYPDEGNEAPEDTLTCEAIEPERNSDNPHSEEYSTALEPPACHETEYHRHTDVPRTEPEDLEPLVLTKVYDECLKVSTTRHDIPSEMLILVRKPDCVRIVVVETVLDLDQIYANEEIRQNRPEPTGNSLGIVGLQQVVEWDPHGCADELIEVRVVEGTEEHIYL